MLRSFIIEMRQNRRDNHFLLKGLKGIFLFVSPLKRLIFVCQLTGRGSLTSQSPLYICGNALPLLQRNDSPSGCLVSGTHLLTEHCLDQDASPHDLLRGTKHLSSF